MFQESILMDCDHPRWLYSS